MEFDEIAFKGAVDLHAVAKMAGCSYEDLKLLNPAVLRAHVAGPQGVTTLRVPPGKGEVLMQKLGSGASDAGGQSDAAAPREAAARRWRASRRSTA